jgi:hypothetical protein
LSLLFCLASACASTPTLIEGGELKNATPWTVRQVRVLLLPTRRVISTSQIDTRGRFPVKCTPRELKADKAELSWVTPDGHLHRVLLDVPRLPSESTQELGFLTFSIHADGNASVRLGPHQE